MARVYAGEGHYELFRYRDREKREIDFLIEREDNALLGIEIKAGSAVEKKDFNHIRWFQKNLISKVVMMYMRRNERIKRRKHRDIYPFA